MRRDESHYLSSSLRWRWQAQPPVVVYRQSITRRPTNDLAIAVDRDRPPRRGDVAINIRTAVKRQSAGIDVKRQPRRMIGAANHASVDAHAVGHDHDHWAYHLYLRL